MSVISTQKIEIPSSEIVIMMVSMMHEITVHLSEMQTNEISIVMDDEMPVVMTILMEFRATSTTVQPFRIAIKKTSM